MVLEESSEVTAVKYPLVKYSLNKESYVEKKHPNYGISISQKNRVKELVKEAILPSCSVHSCGVLMY